MRQIRSIIAALLVISPFAAHAGIIITILEDGGDVVASYSGTINLSATNGYDTDSFGLNSFRARTGTISFTTADTDVYAIYLDIWTPFGPGDFGRWDEDLDNPSGDVLNLYSAGDNWLGPSLGVPFGYVSGNLISGSAIKSSSSFAELGFTPGSYRTTFTNGISTDFILINIGPVSPDRDGDGFADDVDNCTQIENADQRDTDGDGIGNMCDADLDNNCAVNFVDLGILKSVFFGADADADFNGDGVVAFIDLGLMKANFFQSPGPSGINNACSPINATYNVDIQPIFFAKCAPCHTGLGEGGHDIGVTYTDSFLPAISAGCAGLNVAECSLVLIQNGDMPPFRGCTGDPALDVGIASCLTQTGQDLVWAWINAGLPE